MTVVFTEPQVEAPTEVLTEREELARILEAAALEVEVRGHAKGDLHAVDGQVCLLGAVMFAEGWSGYGDHVHRGGYGINWTELVAWNNAAGTTGDQVAAKLRELAAHQRNREDA